MYKQLALLCSMGVLSAQASMQLTFEITAGKDTASVIVTTESGKYFEKQGTNGVTVDGVATAGDESVALRIRMCKISEGGLPSILGCYDVSVAWGQTSDNETKAVQADEPFSWQVTPTQD